MEGIEEAGNQIHDLKGLRYKLEYKTQTIKQCTLKAVMKGSSLNKLLTFSSFQKKDSSGFGFPCTELVVSAKREKSIGRFRNETDLGM